MVMRWIPKSLEKINFPRYLNWQNVAKAAGAFILLTVLCTYLTFGGFIKGTWWHMAGTSTREFWKKR